MLRAAATTPTGILAPRARPGRPWVVANGRGRDRPWRGLWTAAADLLWGSRCVGCGEGGAGLCGGCSSPLFGPAAARTVMTRDGAGLTVFSAAPYSDGVAAAIPAFKDHGRRDLLRPLAIGLATAIGEAASEPTRSDRPQTSRVATGRPVVWLVPVAASRASRRARGMAPVLLLSRRAAAILRRDAGFDVRLAAGLLSHVRAVSDQAGLGQTDRRRNLNGAIAARPGPMLDAVRSACEHGQTVLLVDDVVTTGATLAESRRALAVAGVPVTAAVVVADTPLQRTVGGSAR
jgi:predicted amidophosphoribosyltransferase